eukprot:CAMPEP_0198564818 /NCGR_PEP_ID=MMETSP1462-20131121/100838_1 /TAXON_ID=1333877 /ORGANISM="Brandtodinium nutriculum, Strain RCC3387" /LENGTH=56 /DNA_ID=CAMNT_0044295801 /DNA_START=61 /DNA_END=228 /DNA_ORIENTATION=-
MARALGVAAVLAVAGAVPSPQQLAELEFTPSEAAEPLALLQILARPAAERGAAARN